MKATFSKALMASCLASAAALVPHVAQAAPDAGLTRVTQAEIAGVHGLTADYVRTPHGYFHASCVQHIDQSEELQLDGSIKRADGNVRRVAACAYPHFLRNGVRVEATTGATHVPFIYNGYLQLVSARLASGTNKLTAYMTVPSNPTRKAGQTLYFFPGLEDYENVVSILQPVLGWNGYGTNEWTIASWNCCKLGTVYVGNSVVVKPGDLIYGTMVNTTLQQWIITATDETQPTLPSAILRTAGYKQVFDWVFAGALETYDVTSCNQFPSKGPIRFTDVRAYVGGQLVANPPWVVEPGTDPETACTRAKVIDARDVNIGY